MTATDAGAVLRAAGRPAVSTGFAGFVVLVLLAVFAVRFDAPLNHDTSWYLNATERMLDGAALYIDIVEVNPPLAFYLTVPPVAFARLAGIAASSAFVAWMLVLAGASILASGRFLRRLGYSGLAYRGLLAGLLLVVTVLPGADFGQREHMALIFLMPYLALTGLRWAGAPVGRMEAAVAGLAAVLGLALKPHFYAVPLLLECAFLLHNRRIRAAFRTENLAIAAGTLAYVAVIFRFTPAYPDVIVPYASAVYNQSYGHPAATVFTRLPFPVAALVLGAGMVFAWRGHLTAFGCVCAVAGTGFAVAYLVQMKGWQYQMYPAMGLAAAMVLTAAVDRYLCGERKSGLSGLASCAAAATMVVIAAAGSAAGLYDTRRQEEIARSLAATGPVKSLYVFSAHVWAGFPLVDTVGAQWASRFPALWLLPGLAQHPARERAGDARLAAIEAYMRRTVLEDFERARPDTVIVDTRRHKSYFGGTRFDYVEFLREDPEFARLWSQYRKSGAGAWYDIYRREPEKAARARPSGQ